MGAQVVQAQMGQDLADGLAARASWVKGLVEEGPKGATEAVEALSAVGTFVALGEQPWWQQWGEDFFQVEERLLAQVFQALAEVGQA